MSRNQRKKPNRKMLQDAEKHLKKLGYKMTFGGYRLVLMIQLSGYSAVEAASHIALLTLARDVDEAKADIDKLAKLAIRGSLMLRVLKHYKDHGMMRKKLCDNDAAAVLGVVTLGEVQRQWLGVVLSDEVRSYGRLANFCGYDKPKTPI